MYGPGDKDVTVMGMVVDSTENIFLGGQSKFVQTSTGEGFVMLVNKFGSSLFAKTYASGASSGDMVQKVFIESTSYIAVGTSSTGTNTFFILVLDNTGAVSKNLNIATDTAKIPNTATINQMHTYGTNAYVVFSNSVVNIIDTSGATDDSYVGLSGEAGSSNIIRIVPHTDKYSIFAVKNGNLAVYWYDTITAANDKNIVTDTAATISTTESLQTSDIDDNASPGNCWIAVYPTTGDKFLAFHYTIDGTTYPVIVTALDISTAAVPLSMTIKYVDADSFFLSTMLTGGQGSVYKVTAASSSPVVVDKKMATSLSGTWFIGSLTGTKYVTAGGKGSGESASLTNIQATIFKSDDAFVVTTYN